MDLIVINASPRGNSNSALIAGSFAEGAARAGAKCEVHALSNRAKWGGAQSAVCRGKHILFVLPLFAECIPGILMEFLEELQPLLHKEASCGSRSMAFILHSGFPEACQRRCCEQYLKKLPAMLDSRFSGILSRGDTFFLHAVEPQQRAWLLDAFRDMGQRFVEEGGSFFFPEAEAFTGPEYYAPREARYYTRIAGLFLEQLAQKQHCSGPLTAAPYEP